MVRFRTTCNWEVWKPALQDHLQWTAQRDFHFGSIGQRLALIEIFSRWDVHERGQNLHVVSGC